MLFPFKLPCHIAAIHTFCHCSCLSLIRWQVCDRRCCLIYRVLRVLLVHVWRASSYRDIWCFLITLSSVLWHKLGCKKKSKEWCICLYDLFIWKNIIWKWFTLRSIATIHPGHSLLICTSYIFLMNISSTWPFSTGINSFITMTDKVRDSMRRYNGHKYEAHVFSHSKTHWLEPAFQINCIFFFRQKLDMVGKLKCCFAFSGFHAQWLLGALALKAISAPSGVKLAWIYKSFKAVDWICTPDKGYALVEHCFSWIKLPAVLALMFIKPVKEHENFIF